MIDGVSALDEGVVFAAGVLDGSIRSELADCVDSADDERVDESGSVLDIAGEEGPGTAEEEVLDSADEEVVANSEDELLAMSSEELLATSDEELLAVIDENGLVVADGGGETTAVSYVLR
jgi:hypothetical protein